GNVGTNGLDEESAHPYIESLVVREFSAISSNWRSGETAQHYLERWNVQLVAEARALPTMAGQELASRVTCGTSYRWTHGAVDMEALTAAQTAATSPA